MIIFYGDDDGTVSRAAKLKALQRHFGEKEGGRAINMLPADGLSAKSGTKGEKLIVNAHGNTNSFRGKDAQELFQILLGKGLTKQRFGSIYLIACNVGEQAQDNSIVQNFARDFAHRIRIDDRTSGIKVYAPRGVVTYTTVTRTTEGQQYKEVTGIVVRTPEKDYQLDEGLLLVQ